METIRVEILNPKAKNLLKELAELNLIKISKEEKSDFTQLLKKIRANSTDEISLEEITLEVEEIRKSRNEK
jgi:hypothetical protein